MGRAVSEVRRDRQREEGGDDGEKARRKEGGAEGEKGGEFRHPAAGVVAAVDQTRAAVWSNSGFAAQQNQTQPSPSDFSPLKIVSTNTCQIQTPFAYSDSPFTLPFSRDIICSCLILFSSPKSV